MVKKAKEKNMMKGAAGMVIPGGLFIGLGVGFLINQLVAGLFIGLGAGFVLSALLVYGKK